MKLLYKPLSILSRAVASRLAKITFRGIWQRLDDREPPAPTLADASLAKVIQASVLEAATLAAFTALADRGAARVFHYLFGVWPGEKSSEGKPQDA